MSAFLNALREEGDSYDYIYWIRRYLKDLDGVVIPKDNWINLTKTELFQYLHSLYLIEKALRK